MNDAELIAAVRGAVQAEVAPLKELLQKLSGLPKTASDLMDKYVELHETLVHLKPLVEDNTKEQRVMARALGELKPMVQRLTIIATETVPELVRRLELLSTQGDGMQGEIHQLQQGKQRAAGDET